MVARRTAEISEEMLRFPLPVIAAINGPAVGLGCSMAILCDIALISSTAYLADPHVAVGLVAGDGGAAFWPASAGHNPAVHYCVTRWVHGMRLYMRESMRTRLYSGPGASGTGRTMRVN